MRKKAALLCLLCCVALLGCRIAASSDVGLVLRGGESESGLLTLEGGAESATRLLQARPLAPPDVYFRGDPHYRLIALTFDDGPDDRFTPMVLDILHAERVKATFFLVGRRAVRRPDLVRRMIAEGHEIGNHSMTHPLLTRVSPARLQSELQSTDHLLRYITGRSPALFRPPYGAFNPRILQVAKSLGYKTVIWDVDSLDWRPHTTANAVLTNVLSGAKTGAIVLEHSGGGVGEDLTDTVRALPEIIRSLKARGYQMVTASEMLSTGRVIPGRW